MKILGKLKSLVGKKSSVDEHALAEETEISEATKEESIFPFFTLQALEELKKLEQNGGVFICSSPDFKCYFKKQHMPLFEEKRGYIKIAFDNADSVTHVCGLLPRLQHEKDRNKIADEKLTLSKIPDCLLKHAVAELSTEPKRNISKARHIMYQDQIASAQQEGSNLFRDPNASDTSLQGAEKEWLDSMHAALIDREYKILLQLLEYLIIARGFREKIEHFLNNKKELEPGSRSMVIKSFEYLAREFQLKEQVITVAQVGTSLEQMFNLEAKETFSIIVELFFCLGYEKEIKGYTTGFI